MSLFPIFLSVACSCFAAHPVDLSDAQPWRPMTGWLVNPSVGHQVEARGNALRFSVAQAGRGMKWNYTPAKPINTADTPILTLRYRARGLASCSQYFIYMSDGSAVIVAENEASPIGMTSLVDDGSVHQISVVVPPMRAKVFAVQVQAGVPGAFVEILDLSFSKLQSAEAKQRVSDGLKVHEGWNAPEAYRPAAMTPNGSAGQWLERLNFKPGWFGNEKITVSGIPFGVHCNEPAVLTTVLDQPDEVSVEMSGKADEIYLLMGAEFVGDESPSIGRGPLTRIQQVERCAVRIDYVDGVSDLIFPRHYPSGVYMIGMDLAVYTVRPTRDVGIERLVLVDGMRQGRFILAGVTVGPEAVFEEQGSIKKPTVASRREVHPLPSGAVRTEAVGISTDSENQRVEKLVNFATKTDWLETPSALFKIDSDGDVDAKLNLKPLANGQIELELKLVNTSSEPVRVSPTFPLLQGLSPGGDPAELSYCFPKLGAAIGDLPISLRSQYGGRFSLQFIDVWHPQAGGIYFLTQDLDSIPKTYWLEKQDAVDIGVDYAERILEPGEEWVLPKAVIGSHEGDWHAALEAYQVWKSSWYAPVVERKDWFREVFNFRQMFLEYPMPEPSGAYNSETKEYSISQVLEQDIADFGGVDYLHIFDWYGFVNRRQMIGDYEPWDYLGSRKAFSNELAKVQAKGIPTGLYLQGVFVHEETEVGLRHKDWEMLDLHGESFDLFPQLLTLCASVIEWQDYLADVYKRVAGELKPNGLYVDSIGMGEWLCYNKKHAHPMPALRVTGETELMAKVRAATPSEVVIYSEEVGTDVSMQCQDGAFTYAVSQSLKFLSPVRLNLNRFAMPDYKTFEIIVCDKPVADDIQSIKQVFFNGDGIWIEGTLPESFTPESCAMISKTHKILRAHRKAFCSMNPVPLIPTQHTQISANSFPSDSENIWTLYNESYSTVRGELIAVEHVAGSEYYDVWDDKMLTPRIEGSLAFLPLKIGPQDVSCVVQVLNK